MLKWTPLFPMAGNRIYRSSNENGSSQACVLDHPLLRAQRDYRSLNGACQRKRPRGSFAP
jgi:hypothetical protein